MAIIPMPPKVLRTIEWQQDGGRPQVQRSSFTGRVKQLIDFGPAPRWSADCTIIPMIENGENARAFAAFEAACQLAGNSFRLPVSYTSQHGALGNLVQNAALSGGSSAGWLVTPANAFGPSLFQAPNTWMFITGPASGSVTGSVIANNPTLTLLSGATRLFLSADAWIGATAAGTLNAAILWYDASDVFLAANTLDLIPGAGPTGQITRRYANFAAPVGAVKWRAQFDNVLSAGLAFVGSLRVSTLPEQATVSGAANAGRSLALSNLARSQRNLRAGQLLTVVLPGDDEQLLRLASDLMGDASGNGTASLATPLRRTPAASAVVEIERPYALMRATHTPGFRLGPGSIVEQSLSCEEAF